MVLQNYQNFIEMTSNMIYIVAHGGGFKCPHKIHLNIQCSGGRGGGINVDLNFPDHFPDEFEMLFFKQIQKLKLFSLEFAIVDCRIRYVGLAVYTSTGGPRAGEPMAPSTCGPDMNLKQEKSKL